MSASPDGAEYVGIPVCQQTGAVSIQRPAVCVYVRLHRRRLFGELTPNLAWASLRLVFTGLKLIVPLTLAKPTAALPPNDLGFRAVHVFWVDKLRHASAGLSKLGGIRAKSKDELIDRTRVRGEPALSVDVTPRLDGCLEQRIDLVVLDIHGHRAARLRTQLHDAADGLSSFPRDRDGIHLERQILRHAQTSGQNFEARRVRVLEEVHPTDACLFHRSTQMSKREERSDSQTPGTTPCWPTIPSQAHMTKGHTPAPTSQACRMSATGNGRLHGRAASSGAGTGPSDQEKDWRRCPIDKAPSLA
eukprot:4074125-Prymnesium_polylepis.2